MGQTFGKLLAALVAGNVEVCGNACLKSKPSFRSVSRLELHFGTIGTMSDSDLPPQRGKICLTEELRPEDHIRFGNHEDVGFVVTSL